MDLLKAALDVARAKEAGINPDVTPLPHQERVLERIQQEPALLVYHGLGSGKTFSSILAGEDLGGTKNVVVPASLRENYRKELDKYVSGPKRYDVMSYQKAIGSGFNPKANLTIFDEAHRMGREESDMAKLPAQAPGKVMLLTGTPVRNHPSEIVPLLKAIAYDRPIPRTAKAFDEKFVGAKEVPRSLWQWITGTKQTFIPTMKNLDQLKELVRGRVDYQASVGEFPDTHEEQIKVEMSPAQATIYSAMLNGNPALAAKVRDNLPASKGDLENMTHFLTGPRQLANNPMAFDTTLKGHPVDHSPKMQRMIQEIQKHNKINPRFQGVIYSNYLDTGILPMADRLNSLGIPTGVFSGAIPDAKRKQMVNDYNSGKTRVLAISGAGAEGLDLKGTRLLQLMEPHWNSARLEQVIGRGVRNRSHSHLPDSERFVKVQRFFATPPKSMLTRLGLAKEEMGADQYMHNLSEQKQDMINQLLTVLKQVGSEPVKSLRKQSSAEATKAYAALGAAGLGSLGLIGLKNLAERNLNQSAPGDQALIEKLRTVEGKKIPIDRSSTNEGVFALTDDKDKSRVTAHPDTSAAAVAHELGHLSGKPANSLMYNLGNPLVGMMAGATGGLHANSYGGSAAGGALAGLMLGAPRLYEEYKANTNALKILRNAGVPESDVDQAAHKLLLNNMVTYGATAAGYPAIAALASHAAKRIAARH